MNSNINYLILESLNSEKYYRISYNNIGIYEAFKKEVTNKYTNGWDIWKEFKNSKHVNWLPLPTIDYIPGCYSYFTKDGYLKFKKETLPLMNKYLNKFKIKIETITKLPGTIIYSDKYQIVVK